MKLLIILTALFTSFTFSTFARHSYYPQYFQDAVDNNTLEGEQLKNELQKILSSQHTKRQGAPDTLGCDSGAGECYTQTSLGYKGARKHLFGNLSLGHLKKDNDYYLYGVYCENKFTTSSKTGKIGPLSIPNSNVLNCEHTWPQSKFTRHDSRYQKSDLHHLFPTDSKANSSRGNHDFGEVINGKDPAPNCDESQVSTRGDRVFQPAINHRGNVARAMFYFAVRYNGRMSTDMERTLKKWHLEDPVDQAERDRNNGVYELQNNRNPFVDYPELVDFIGDL